MNIKRIEYKITKNQIERLSVDITVIKEDDTKVTSTIPFSGNVNTAAYWGLTETIKKLNEMLERDTKVTITRSGGFPCDHVDEL